MDKKKDRSREKSKSGGRGAGKKMFIANEDELALREREFEGQKAARNRRRGEEGGAAVKDDSEEEEGEEQQGQEGAESVFAFDRTPAAAVKPAATEAGEGAVNRPQTNNPNHMNKQADPSDASQGMNRREREAVASAKAREDYQRKHMAGETEQAQKELARLAIVRARREAAKQKREVEGRPPGWTAEGVASSSDDDDDDDEEDKPAKPAAASAPVSAVVAKKKAAAAAEEEPEAAADGGPPKLKSMDIKKMSGDQLKDHLKARNLDIQGQKKDLMKRLCDYEAARA